MFQKTIARGKAMDERIAADETEDIGTRSIAVHRLAARAHKGSDEEKFAAGKAAQVAFERKHPGSVAAAREIERRSGREGAGLDAEAERMIAEARASMSKIRVTLSSAAMGDVDEMDFDLWARFVTEHIDEAAGVEVGEVDQFRFGEAGEDRIEGADEEQRQAIRSWLSVTGWDVFCGETWEEMRGVEEQRTAFRAFQEQVAADLRGKGVFVDLLAPPSGAAQAHLDKAGDYARGWNAAEAALVSAADSCGQASKDPPTGSSTSFSAGWADKLAVGL